MVNNGQKSFMTLDLAGLGPIKKFWSKIAHAIVQARPFYYTGNNSMLLLNGLTFIKE
jgi:hypothetical protein